MAELTRLPASDRPSESDYQPISGLAVAAVIVSGFYGLIVLTITLTAFYNRKPVILPGILLIALIGVGLSIAARIAIDKSEGTRAGRRLVTWSWWISFLAGAGYAAYLGANELAVRQQSLAYAEAWFDLLKEKNIEAAFVQSLEPGVRKPGRGPAINPANKAELEARFGNTDLLMFRNHDLIRLFARNDKEHIVIEPKGMSNWNQEAFGFTVIQAFTIRTPEGEVDVRLNLNAVNPNTGQEREWYVKLDASPVGSNRRLTAYGKALQELQFDARAFMENWLRLLNNDQGSTAYLLTRPVEERRKVMELREAIAQSMVLCPQTALWFRQQLLNPKLLPPDSLWIQNRLTDPPEYATYVENGSWFKMLDGRPVEEEKLPVIREMWKTGGFRPAGVSNPSDRGITNEIVWKDDQLLMILPLELVSNRMGGSARGQLVLQATNTALLSELRRLRQDGIEHPTQFVTGNDPVILGKMAPDWVVKEVRSNLEFIQQSSPGGPGLPRP